MQRSQPLPNTCANIVPLVCVNLTQAVVSHLIGGILKGEDASIRLGYKQTHTEMPVVFRSVKWQAKAYKTAVAKAPLPSQACMNCDCRLDCHSDKKLQERHFLEWKVGEGSFFLFPCLISALVVTILFVQ